MRFPALDVQRGRGCVCRAREGLGRCGLRSGAGRGAGPMSVRSAEAFMTSSHGHEAMQKFAVARSRVIKTRLKPDVSGRSKQGERS